MKRRFEITPLDTFHKKTKQQKANKGVFIPSLPPDLWQVIASGLDFQSRRSLRATSLFFAQDTKSSLSYFHDLVREKFLDYAHESELADYIPFPSNVVRYKMLIGILKFQLAETRLKLLKSYESDSEIVNTDLDNIMFSACQLGRIAILELLINSSRCDIARFINEKKIGMHGEEKMTALGYAAAYERKRMFTLLLKNGAQFTVGENLPGDNRHLIYFDLGYYFNTAVTPLHIIALRSDENWLSDILEYFPELLKSLFTGNYKKGLELICKNLPEQLAMLIETDKSLLVEGDVAGWGLLHWASCLDKTRCIEILLEKGANVDAGDIPPLYLACAAGKLSAIKKLISHHAPIEAFAMNQSTCLHLTANNGHSDCTQYLIDECKLDVNSTNDNDDTPLFLAQLEVNSEDMALSALEKAKKATCAELLIARGATNDVSGNSLD